MINRIAIGADHAGFDYKEAIIEYLKERDIKSEDFGTHSNDSVDYPDFAHPVAELVGSKEVKLGVLICGSANGVSMTANKHQEVRAAICWEPEIAALARQHNNANICCIPARFISIEKAKEIIRIFLDTEFEGGRHERRVGKICIC